MAATRYTMTGNDGRKVVVRLLRNSTRGRVTGAEISADNVRGKVSLTANQVSSLKDFLNRRG